MVYYLLNDFYEYQRLPVAVALALGALCLIICLGGYGFLHWQASNFRMTLTTGICFTGVVLIVLALQLGFTLFIIDRPQSAFIVFMGFNLAPVMLLSYLHGVIAKPITFQQLLRLQGRDPKFEQECAALEKNVTKLKWVLLLMSVGALLVFGLIMHYVFDSVFGWQVSAAVLFCDFASFVHSSSGLTSDPMLLHFLALVSRIVLFAAWDDYWFVAVSINFLIFIAFFVYHVVDQRHPKFTKEDALDSVVGSIERALSEKREKEQAERVAAHEEAERAARELEQQQYGDQGGFSLGNAAASIERGVDEIKIALREHVPGARFVSDGAQAVSDGARELAEELERKTKSAFKSPEFALTILSLIYITYVIIAIYADLKDPSWSTKLFPEIELSSPHPQYEFGIFTIVIIICATFFFLAFRCYEINSFQWNRRVAFAGASFLAISIGSCVGLSILVESDFIYIFGIYIPLIAVVATLTYCNWRRQDYRWNGWLNYQMGVWRKMVKEKKGVDQKMKEEEQQRLHTQSIAQRDGQHIAMDDLSAASSSVSEDDAHSKGINLFPFSNKLGSLNLTLRTRYNCPHPWSVELEPAHDPRTLFWMLKDLLFFQHTAPDYIILASLGALTLLCIGLGLHLGAYGSPGTSYFIASLVGMVIFTVFVLLKWFNTFTVGSMQILIQSGLLIYSTLAMEMSLEVSHLSAIGFAVLYPAAMAFIMAMYSWKSNGWKLSEVIKRLIGISCILTFAYIITFMVLSKLYLESMIALVIFFVAVYFIALVMVWSSNDFHLPRIYFRSAVAVSSIIILIALIIILILNKTWFQMFTVLWVFTLIGLIAYTIQETRQSETRKLLPSAYIFPIYEYQPSLTEIKITVRNNGIIALILVAGLMMMWGFIAALLIQPPFVGWIFFCLGALLFWLIAIEALFRPINAFWANFRLVQDTPQLIDQARETALKSQLGSSDTVFEDEDEEDGDGVGAEEDDGTTSTAAAAVSTADAFKTLRRLQRYWMYEEKSEVDHLQDERRKFIARPQVPEDADVSERARFIAETIAQFDAKIAKVFEEQTRILVMFQLLINIGAQALQKKNRARVKDFLRKYFARKLEIQAAREAGLPIPPRRRTTVAAAGPGAAAGAGMNEQFDEDDFDDNYPLIDLATANAVEIHEWAAKNEELKRKAFQYVQELEDSSLEAKRLQEEQRAAVAERNKLANSDMPPVMIPSGPSRSAQVAAMPSPTAGTSSNATAKMAATSSTSLTVGDTKKVVRDDFSYRQRAVSFDIDHLNIRGSTAEAVVAQARAAVEKIIAKHSQVKAANSSAGIDETALFADPFFPKVADLDQLIEAGTDPADKPTGGAANKKRKACWKRMRELSAQPKIFASGTLDPTLIIQGDIEDCYLLSALSVIARTPERIKNLFLVSEYNEYGIYGMTFFVDGEWRAIFVDDQFPYLGNKLAFARSKNPDEFWLPILEKCYAKLYAGYPSIIGGLVHVSFKDLTGGITDEVALDAPDSGAYDGRLWQKLFTFYNQGYLMGCGNPKPNAGNFTAVNGIIQGHAYAILHLIEVEGNKLIKLRNPWSVKH